MNYNAEISISDVTDESGSFEEPVSIDEMKDYLRLEGYVDDDESTSDDLSDFDFDDMLIADLIRASREAMEKISGCTIVPKTLELVFTNLCGMFEIPYGPIGTIISLYDEDENEVTSESYKIIGNDRKFVKYPCSCNMVLTYEAGYETLPKSLKIDIMRLCAYMYENRGDDASIQKFASQLAGKYSRNDFIV